MRILLDNDNAGIETSRYSVPSQPEGKIRLGVQTTFHAHRSGWAYAMEALLPEHNENGVLYDGYLDRTFGPKWGNRFADPALYRRPWIGVFHHAPTIPAWVPNGPQLDLILNSRPFQEHVQHCHGLFALSEHLACWLRERVSVPVSTLYLPTESTEVVFDFESFLRNPCKRILGIGFWLRRQTSLSYLPLDASSPYRKTRLQCESQDLQDALRAWSRLEFIHDMGRNRKLEARYRDNVETLPYQGSAAYDRLFAQNLVFLDLYDSSANNTVVECIARATPLLVNRLPAVAEYLGEDYPFFYDSLEQAAEMALDLELVNRTHEYLLTCPTRSKLTQQYFLDSFRKSEVYQRLPSVSISNVA